MFKSYLLVMAIIVTTLISSVSLGYGLRYFKQNSLCSSYAEAKDREYELRGLVSECYILVGDDVLTKEEYSRKFVGISVGGAD